MDSTRRLPPPENPPNNRSSARRPPHPSILKEILDLPPLPPPTIDERSEREDMPMSPSPAANSSTREGTAADGGGRHGGPHWVIWSDREEVSRSPAAAVANRLAPEERGVAMSTEAGRSRVVSSRSVLERRPLREAALGFRVLGMVFCLVSFSVMAADKTRGWAGDSFERYKEYRYCISVTVIGFVYSGFQAYVLTHYLVTGKHVIRHSIRYYFDFSMDQILAYLLLSSSSSAATRTDNWVLNWGEDEFTKMATASIGMSFLAFIAFAFSSLISGYNLCT